MERVPGLGPPAVFVAASVSHPMRSMLNRPMATPERVAFLQDGQRKPYLTASAAVSRP